MKGNLIFLFSSENRKALFKKKKIENFIFFKLKNLPKKSKQTILFYENPCEFQPKNSGIWAGAFCHDWRSQSPDRSGSIYYLHFNPILKTHS